MDLEVSGYQTRWKNFIKSDVNTSKHLKEQWWLVGWKWLGDGGNALECFGMLWNTLINDWDTLGMLSILKWSWYKVVVQ